MNWINSESWTETAVGPLALWNWCLPLNWLGRSSRAPWVLPLTILIQHLFASHHLHQHLEFKSFKTLWPRWHLSLTGSKQFLLSGFKTKLDGPSSCLTLTTLEQLSSRRYLTLWRCFSFHFKSQYSGKKVVWVILDGLGFHFHFHFHFHFKSQYSGKVVWVILDGLGDSIDGTVDEISNFLYQRLTAHGQKEVKRKLNLIRSNCRK